MAPSRKTAAERRLAKLEKQASDIVGQAKSIVVKTDEDYEELAIMLLGVKALHTDITEHHEPMREATHAAYKKVLETRNRMTKPLEKAESILKDKGSDYLQSRSEKQEKIAERVKKGGRGQVTKAPRVPGVSSSQKWEYVVVDIKKMDPDYLIPDAKAISALVRELGPDAEEVVGKGAIKVEQKTDMRASRG